MALAQVGAAQLASAQWSWQSGLRLDLMHALLLWWTVVIHPRRHLCCEDEHASHVHCAWKPASCKPLAP